MRLALAPKIARVGEDETVSVFAGKPSLSSRFHVDRGW